MHNNSSFNDAHLSSFRPFDALEGFTALCEEKKNNKYPEERPMFMEEPSDELNEQLNSLQEGCYVSVTYWMGKRYAQEGMVSKINIPQGGFKVNGVRIEFKQLLSLTYLNK